jgi:hypothetical protein
MVLRDKCFLTDLIVSQEFYSGSTSIQIAKESEFNYFMYCITIQTTYSNKIGKVYSLLYNEIPKVFLMPHHGQ